jgi:hypothetical protein
MIRQLLELFIDICHPQKRLSFLVILRFSLQLKFLGWSFPKGLTNKRRLPRNHVLHTILERCRWFHLNTQVEVTLSKLWINILKPKFYWRWFKESAWVPVDGRITSGKSGLIVTISLAFAFYCMKLGLIIFHEDGMIEYMLVLFDIHLPKSVLIQLK